jgi:hypothetical protein
VLELPDDLRAVFREPLGRVFADPAALLAAPGAGEPLVAVGDVVTYHLLEAGRPPDVAVVDGRTERERVDERIEAALPDPDCSVSNPPATLSRELLETLVSVLDRGEPTVVGVDGEEDLATLPALLATPIGGSVVYGQPGEGMVLVPVTEASRERARTLLGRMCGDADAALSLLDPPA